MKVLQLFFMLFLGLSSLAAQESQVDTFYVMMPDGYLVDEEISKKFCEEFQQSKDSGDTLRLENHFLLYASSSTRHNLPHEHYFGLIQNKKNIAEAVEISKLSLQNKKVRPLKFFYATSLGDDFMMKWWNDQLMMYVIKEEDYTNDALEVISIFPCDLFLRSSME